MDLSIIVPVYNVEKYIRACILSIFQQGLKDNSFELILINDGSTDRSMKMIEDIISQHSNIIIINQKNQGLSVARNNGIAQAKGKFIQFVDSDDLLVDNSLWPLLDKALKVKADLVVADYIRIKEEEKIFNPTSQNSKTIMFEEKYGEDLFFELDPLSCYVWRTIYRKEFLIENHISFIPNIYYEDVPFTHECYLKAKKCLKTPWPLYIYRWRTGSITSSFTPQKAENFIIAVAKTWNLLYECNPSSKAKYKLEDNVYILFLTIIYHILHSIKSSTQRKKLIDFFNINIPTYNFNHDLKQKITTLLTKKMPHSFIELYYLYSKFFWHK